MSRILKFITRLPEAVEIVLLSCLMVTSCSGTKKIADINTSESPGWKNLCYFHAGDSTWIVRPVTPMKNSFTGEIFSPLTVKRMRNVHIYAEPLSMVKIENGRLSVPMENIVKVDNFKINAGIVITGAIILGLLFMIPVFL